jgi:aminopeptidase N
VLDTRDLSIKSVKVDGQAAKYEYGEKSEAFGQALRITPATVLAKAESKVTVTIEYSTSPTASAIQWLDARYVIV